MFTNHGNRRTATMCSQGSRALTLFALLAATGTAAGQSELFDNGPFVTSPGGGSGGADLSAVQTTLLNQTYGYSNQLNPAGDRVADDFTLTSASTLTSVLLYGFQTNASTTASTFTSLNLRIWSGRPGDVGSQIVFGDTTTNRLVSASWASCFRARDDSSTNTQRPIYAIQASINPPLPLAPGDYWLDWQASGSLAGGPFACFVTLPGLTGAPGANARYKSGAQSSWITVVDSGSNVPQELAFVVIGTAGGGPPPCYANCDGSTGNPRLTGNDFQCFLDAFVAGGSYANCDGLGGLTGNDFQCFLDRFVAGCS